jgi:HSF-type DNA-binding
MSERTCPTCHGGDRTSEIRVSLSVASDAWCCAIVGMFNRSFNFKDKCLWKAKALDILTYFNGAQPLCVMPQAMFSRSHFGVGEAGSWMRMRTNILAGPLEHSNSEPTRRLVSRAWRWTFRHILDDEPVQRLNRIRCCALSRNGANLAMGAPSSSTTAEFEDLFPAKLHYVLEQVESDDRSDVITWQPHGKAFLVKDKKEFVKNFLPKYVSMAVQGGKRLPGTRDSLADPSAFTSAGFDRSSGPRSSGSSTTTTSSESPPVRATALRVAIASATPRGGSSPGLGKEYDRHAFRNSLSLTRPIVPCLSARVSLGPGTCKPFMTRNWRGGQNPAAASSHAMCRVLLFLFLPPDRGAYYHPLFVKGDRDLCRHIRRIKYKGTGPRKPRRPDSRPDLYQSGDAPFRSVAASIASLRVTGDSEMSPSAVDILIPQPVTSIPDGSFPMSLALARSVAALSFPGLVATPSSAFGLERGREESVLPSYAGLGGPPPSLLTILSRMPSSWPDGTKVSYPASAAAAGVPSPLSELCKQILRAAVADAWREAAAAPGSSSFSPLRGGSARSKKSSP